jgi:hypothetical protein
MMRFALVAGGAAVAAASGLCDAECEAAEPGRVSPQLADERRSVYDPELVYPDQLQVISLTHLLHRGDRAPNKTLQLADLRYISLVDASAHPEWRGGTGVRATDGTELDTRLLFFARRASKDCPRGMWHTMCQRLATHQWLLMHPVGRNDTLAVTRRPVVEDSALATNMDVALVQQPHGQAIMYAAGGTYYARDDALGYSTYSRRQRARDGISLLRAHSLGEVLNGSWLPRVTSGGPRQRSLARPQRVLDGRQPGCIEIFKTYTPYCNFDGKLAIVRYQRRYLVYVRANTVFSGGGRFLQVAASEDDDPASRYGAFTMVKIQGYDVQGPLAPHAMLLGLFPLNEGTLRKRGVPEDDEGMPRATPDPDCKGTCYIALSHSCDGIHWSRFVKLVSTTGDRGRTFDHPVSGFVRSGSSVHIFIHRDVPGISPYAPTASRLVRFALRASKLRQLMLAARLQLPGCSSTGFQEAWEGLRWNSSFERLRNSTRPPATGMTVATRSRRAHARRASRGVR